MAQLTQHPVKHFFKVSLLTLSMMLSASAMNAPNITDFDVLSSMGAFNDGPHGVGGNDWDVEFRIRVSDNAGNPVIMPTGNGNGDYQNEAAFVDPAFPLGNTFISQDGIDVFGLNHGAPPVHPTLLTLEPIAHPGGAPHAAIVADGMNTGAGGIFNPAIAVGLSPVFVGGLTGDVGQLPYLAHHNMPGDVGKYVAHYVGRVPYNPAVIYQPVGHGLGAVRNPVAVPGAGGPYNIDFDVYLTSVNPAPVGGAPLGGGGAPPPPVLVLQGASGLNAPVYNAVIDPLHIGGLSIADQNAIMVAVHGAIGAHAANKVNRDAAIDAAIGAAVGGAPGAGYAAALKAAVDADPAVAVAPPPAVLVLQGASGLNAPVYNAVIDPLHIGGLSIADQNAIMVDVAAAIAVPGQTKVNRDAAIDAALVGKGAPGAGYAAALKAAVDLEHPIAPVFPAPAPIVHPAPAPVIGGEVMVALPQSAQQQQQGAQAFVQPSSGRVIFRR